MKFIHIHLAYISYLFTLPLIVLISQLSYGAEDNQIKGDSIIIGENVVDTWLKAVDDAEESIYIATYKLTSKSALKALVKAHKRNVEIKLILDGEAAGKKKSLAREAVRYGLEVTLWPSDTLGKLHTKLYIFDGRRVIIGSFNLTESAEKGNTELLFSAEDETIVQDCISAWISLELLTWSGASSRM